MLTAPIRKGYSAFTLAELLVVIAIVAILAGVVGPNIGGWNCRQDVTNDFAKLNSFLYSLRSEAQLRNRTMMARVYKPSTVGAFQGPEFEKKSCSTGSGWNYRGASGSGDIVDFSVDKSILAVDDPTICFHSDGTATSGSYTISRVCDGTDHQFSNQIFAATGFIETRKFNSKTSTWDEI